MTIIYSSPLFLYLINDIVNQQIIIELLIVVVDEYVNPVALVFFWNPVA
jgi:hypothetical protein